MEYSKVHLDANEEDSSQNSLKSALGCKNSIKASAYCAKLNLVGKISNSEYLVMIPIFTRLYNVIARNGCVIYR